MNNNTIYKKYTLPKQQLFSFLLFTIIVFFFYFFTQFWRLNTSLSVFHQSALLHMLFILNIFTIRIITERTQKTMEEIIFSNITINLNFQNKNINFSQKREIKKENKSGFNFYVTLTANNLSNNENKIKKSLKTPLEHLFKEFLYKENFYTIMAREHWYRMAYLTFLYFILFILLLEMINIGKEIFYINMSENFHLLILSLIFSDFIIRRVKSIFTKFLSIFSSILLVYLYFIFQDNIIFNQNYSIILMILSLFILLFITSTLIKVLKLDSDNINIKKEKIDNFFLIDMYFNRTLLSYESNESPKKKGIMRELFYTLIGFLFTISVPIIIEEVKTPSVIFEGNKGQTIEKTR